MTDKPQVLIAGDIELIEDEVSQFESECGVLEHLQSKSRQDFAKDCQPGGRYDSLKAIYYSHEIIDTIGKFDAEMFGKILPVSLVSVSSLGAGYDKLDVQAALKRKIQVSNSPGAVDDATATTALYLMIGALRRFAKGEMHARAGKWDKEMGRRSHDPEGKVLGILGLGGIGRALARRALALGMTIIYHNRNPVDDAILNEAKLAGQVSYCSTLKELLQKADVISIHVPLSDKTRGYIDQACFDQMKDGAVIVNTARGAVIDQDAMIKALESGKLYAAGLDVFTDEPDIPEYLKKSEHVSILPHLGTATAETDRKMKLRVLENVKSAYKTGKVIDIVPELRELVQ